MQQKSDKSLSVAELQTLQDSIAQLNAQLSFAIGLSTTESRKGGWYLSKNARELARQTLLIAKQTPTYYPLIDIAAFERDVTFLMQLHAIAPQIDQLKSKIDSTQRILQKETSDQAFYVYNQLQLMYDNGISVSDAFHKLKQLMPRSGKKKQKKEE